MVRKYLRWDPWYVQFVPLYCVIWWLTNEQTPSIECDTCQSHIQYRGWTAG